MTTGSVNGKKNAFLDRAVRSHIYFAVRYVDDLTVQQYIFLVILWQEVSSYLNWKIYNFFLCFGAFALIQGHAFLLVLWKATKEELLSQVWMPGLETGSSGPCFIPCSFVRGPGIPGAEKCRLVPHNRVTSTQRKRVLIQGSELLRLSSNCCSYERPELWEL